MVSSDKEAVLKSPSDKREYEYVRLRNGLSALLIHDPEIKLAAAAGGQDAGPDDEDDESEYTTEGDDESDEEDDEEEAEEDEEEEDGDEPSRRDKTSKKRAQTKKAAAALCVTVGSYSDPKDAEGLAHLLEHMLFMGSSKFPDENEYDSFLAEHGGSSNAYTELEYTVYHFDVNHLYLKPALDRFSQFFVSPLIKLDSLEREVQAVDSEFVQALQNDSFRLGQVKATTAPPDHPYNRFSWGNEKSLTDAISKCVDIRQKLLNFYRQHYLAERMKLVVLGGESLETLKEWAVELFEAVPEGRSREPVFTWDRPVWPAGKLYRVESVKDQHCLSLTWPLPCLDAEYLKKPQDYISHLLGHEGTGSLLKLLKAKGWAVDLAAGVGEDGIDRSTAGYLFSVDVKLTLSGLQKVHDIIGHLYEYVRMLRAKKPQEWVFEEMRAVMEMDFRFVEEESADDYVATLSRNMHLYPVKHSIYGDYAYEQWDPQLVEKLLDRINPSNMRVDVITKSFDRNTEGVHLEPWFGVHYIVEDIPQHFIDQWTVSSDLNSAFHLPVVNDFISRDFSIKISGDEPILPVLISKEPSMKAWYKLDKTFERPKANVYVLITCRMDSIRSEVLAQVYVMLLKDALNETLYMASVASLSSSVSASTYNIEFKVHGYNEKLPVLIRKISELFRTLVVQEDRFQVMKEQLERAYRNANLKPLTHSASLRVQLLVEPCWSSDEKLECLSSLTAQDVNNFIPQLFGEAHVEALCHGNLTKEEALDLVKIVNDAVVAKPLLEKSKPKKTTIKLPCNAGLVYNADVANDQEENSVVEKYFQIDLDLGVSSVRERALVDLFEHIAYEPFFNQLRTHEQLGYRVECGSRLTNGVIGFCFRIQSSKYGPKHLDKRIDAFISRFLEFLDDMPEDVFKNYKDCLIAEKLEKDSCLSDETDRYWEHILDQRYVFDEPKRVAELLKDLKKSDLVTWYKNYIRAGGSQRRSLCINVWGCKLKDGMHKKNKTKKSKQPQIPVVVIDSIRKFKDGAEMYPAFGRTEDEQEQEQQGTNQHK